MESIIVAGVISGADILNDLLDRIGEKLALSGDLRATDAYRYYAAKVLGRLNT